MTGKILPIFMLALCLVVPSFAASNPKSESKTGTALQPPASYASEDGNRIWNIVWKDFGKVQITVRIASAPGVYNLWHGEGRQKDKDVIFSKVVENDEDKGPEYLASVSQSKITVKINSGKGKEWGGDLSGVFHHIADDKLTALAKKDSTAAEKKLEDELREAAKKAAPADKPAIAEWKRRWPDMHNKLASKTEKQEVAASTAKTEAQWLALASASAEGMNFIGQPASKDVKAGWDGEYEDGFGGSVSLKSRKSGELEFEFRCTRSPEAGEVFYEGVCPAVPKDAKSAGREITADFTDTSKSALESGEKTHVHFKLLGRYLIVGLEHPRSFMSRGWLDGVYRKRPPPKE